MFFFLVQSVNDFHGSGFNDGQGKAARSRILQNTWRRASLPRITLFPTSFFRGKTSHTIQIYIAQFWPYFYRELMNFLRAKMLETIADFYIHLHLETKKKRRCYMSYLYISFHRKRYEHIFKRFPLQYTRCLAQCVYDIYYKADIATTLNGLGLSFVLFRHFIHIS